MRPWLVLAAIFVAGMVGIPWLARRQGQRVRQPLPPAGALVLERAVSIDGPESFQPSGLALADGKLYTVSDKTSTSLFEIVLGPGDQATARPAFPIVLPEARGEGLDFEGLAVEWEGTFLVLSEARAQVLRVNAEWAVWLPIDFAGPAGRAGLLATRGAGLEGVASFGGNIVVAAERQPRGLLVEAGRSVKALVLDDTRLPMPRGRPPDFSDLATSGGRLYALARNAEAVVELDPDDRFQERRWWSFAAASAAHPYADQRFGMAEGLAIDKTRLYIVLDNNGVARAGAPLDRRPLLFVFRRPAEM